MRRVLVVPESFLVMPRWWRATAAERAWLADLPGLVARQCARWGLAVEGEPLHGSNALVVPVASAAGLAVLRLAPPTDDVGPLVRALDVWRGHGVVALHAADPEAGALLLERLDPHDSLTARPLEEAFVEAGRAARRLAVPLPDDVLAGVPDTSDVVRARTAELAGAWERAGRPLGEGLVGRARRAAEAILATSRVPVAVDADLHFGQVLRAPGGGWRVVDPVLQAGDVERTAVEVLWHRVDEMADADVPRWFAVLVEAAGLDPDLARAWAVWRVTDYLLWGLENGLTQDPARCARLLRMLA